VALEPTNPYAHRALGQIHLMRDDPAGALPHLRLAADQPPTDPITLYTLAQCLMAQAGPGQLDEAEACLNQALALGPHPIWPNACGKPTAAWPAKCSEPTPAMAPAWIW
jgi:Flp pilus assembly protein TadD